MANFFIDPEKYIQSKIRKALQLNGLRQASPHGSWFQEARKVNQRQGDSRFVAKPSIFKSKKTGKEMQAESQNERSILAALDTMPGVKWFDTQCFKFEYEAADSQYEYTPDIIVGMEHGQIVVIEAKPAAFVCAQSNYRKYLAGKQLCGRKDWHFLILSSKEGLIEDMAAYRVDKEVEADFVKRLGDKEKGLSKDDIEAFKTHHELKDSRNRAIAAIALRNDLAFRVINTKSQRQLVVGCAKLEDGCSWSRVIM